jgi:hypothetical protein
MYLVLSALTSSPISLVAATKASAFSFRVCTRRPCVQPASLFGKKYVLNAVICFTSNFITVRSRSFCVCIDSIDRYPGQVGTGGWLL